MKTNQPKKREKLQRKQILLSPENIEKIKMIAEITGQSESEVIRSAIEEYQPGEPTSEDFSELLRLLNTTLEQACDKIDSTKGYVRMHLAHLLTDEQADVCKHPRTPDSSKPIH